MHKIFYNKKELIETLITKDDVVLDLGFFGQVFTVEAEHAPHNLLKQKAKEVYALDLDFDRAQFSDEQHYRYGSAEDFDFGDIKFDVVFAGDLIEHLSNPGLFLNCANKVLKPGGRLIVTTPNCFNLWNLAGKLSHYEPVVNHDHTCYFNEKTLKQLYKKNSWKIDEIFYVYTLGNYWKESWKKKVQNVFYWLFSKFTTKYLETIVTVSIKEK